VGVGNFSRHLNFASALCIADRAAAEGNPDFEPSALPEAPLVTGDISWVGVINITEGARLLIEESSAPLVLLADVVFPPNNRSSNRVCKLSMEMAPLVLIALTPIAALSVAPGFRLCSLSATASPGSEYGEQSPESCASFSTRGIGANEVVFWGLSVVGAGTTLLVGNWKEAFRSLAAWQAANLCTPIVCGSWPDLRADTLSTTLSSTTEPGRPRNLASTVLKGRVATPAKTNHIVRCRAHNGADTILYKRDRFTQLAIPHRIHRSVE